MEFSVTTFMDVICWVTLLLVWLVGALYNFFKTRTVKRITNSTIIWFVGVVFIWFIGKCIPQSYWIEFTYSTEWIKVIGAVILILFTGLAIWSRLVLGRMWTADVAIKENHKLYTKGPYSLTRHPIYTGILGMLLGSVLMNGFGLGVILYFISMLVLIKYKTSDEERLLIETFGEEYLNFKRCTPQLFPTIKSLRKMNLFI
ncbi:MAG: isoprenylcysteine carboxylmethyltransferase family protein [Bacillota bacterium]|nr:isoprenylcysteine carboxylmethyltransferase family protein [Bacillota bacterium]